MRDPMLRIVAMHMLKLNVFPDADARPETLWRQMQPSIREAALNRAKELLDVLEIEGYVLKQVE